MRVPVELALSAVLQHGDSKPVSWEEIRDRSFPEQDAFVVDQARYLDSLCTRRAGKSNGLALRYLRTMRKHPGCFCPYTALTRESAKNIMWPVLQEMDERFKIGAKFTESNLTVTMPERDGGSRLQLFGADMKNFIKRLKGIKTPGAGIDEAQDFGGHLVSLVDAVFGPAILDYADGWLALMGTPGPIPHGYFYEVTELKRYGFSHHAWSLFQNPYLPDARAFVADLQAKKQWPDDHPTLLREYKGLWVLDLDALVFKYDKSKNDYAARPEKGKWEYVIGVDLGFDDADAIAVIGWQAHEKRAYLIEEHVHTSQGITELAERLGAIVRQYDPLKIVMDTGGLGKKIAEEVRKRYQLPIQAAEKDRKFEYIEILNDALRTGRFFAKADSRFADDCTRVKWDTDSNLLRISDVFHSDICDAVLYAFRESLHWLSEPEAVKLTPRSPEWFQEQERLLEEAAQTRLSERNSVDNWPELTWNE